MPPKLIRPTEETSYKILAVPPAALPPNPPPGLALISVVDDGANVVFRGVDSGGNDILPSGGGGIDPDTILVNAAGDALTNGTNLLVSG